MVLFMNKKNVLLKIFRFNLTSNLIPNICIRIINYAHSSTLQKRIFFFQATETGSKRRFLRWRQLEWFRKWQDANKKIHSKSTDFIAYEKCFRKNIRTIRGIDEQWTNWLHIVWFTFCFFFSSKFDVKKEIVYTAKIIGF